MERCAFCQAELKGGEHFCRHCGRAQPSALLIAPEPQPATPQAAATKRCPNCGEELPEWANFCGNCRSTQPLPALAQPRMTASLEPRTTTPLEQTRRCPNCGAESPAWARFCGACSQPLDASSGDISSAETVISALPIAPGVIGAPFTPETPGALPTFPSAYSGPQSGFSHVPGVGAGPQSGAPNVPGAPGYTQGSMPTMSNAPTLPHTALSQPGAPAARTAGKGVLRGLRYKLLGTVPAKIIAAAVAATVVVTAGGATAAYILTRPDPVIQVTSDFRPTGHAPPVGAPMTVLHVTGQDFSGSSSVTFSLDGKAAPGTRPVSSDSKGNIKADLTVTVDWRYGSHALTATDANHYTTRTSVRVEIIPRPMIAVMSQYQKDGTPAGSESTSFHISGQWFSYNSPVTFLLDGQVAPGSQPVTTDANGSLTTDLTVTGDWSLGNHALRAKDAQDYTTDSGMPVAIVNQGEAGTPGPNGAPADDASFTLTITIEEQNPYTGQSNTRQEILIITGQSDPNGGTVCQSHDNNQPYTESGEVYDISTNQPSGITYQETLTSTCSGSYKSGQLTYTQTITSDQYTLSNGVTCQGQTPYQVQSLSGSFSSPTDSSGNWNFYSYTINCDPNPQNYMLYSAPDQQASWSGTTG